MDGILALGHFCETHGPCVVLCTQKYDSELKQGPHTLSVPWCEACQSLQLDLALVSKENEFTYVTTRTPLQQEAAFCLRQATVRSLSCEQEGTLYFGDNERGHVFSHSFIVHDSLARGFQRKYAIIMLMKDKNNLINRWPHLCKYTKEIAQELQQNSAAVNEREQEQMSQRAVRQAQGSPNNVGRSLSQLTGKPAVYAHLHLWFAWILGCQIAEETHYTNKFLPLIKPSSFLRTLYQEMGEKVFRQVCNLLLTGVVINCSDSNIITALHSLIPDTFLPNNNKKCCLLHKDTNEWRIEINCEIPGNISTVQKNIEQALSDLNLTESALEPQLCSFLTECLNSIKVLSWCPQVDLKLLQSLNISKSDTNVIDYWLSNITTADKHKNVMKTIHACFS